MDTRSKIVTRADNRSLSSSSDVVVAGYFDPLLPSHVRRLRAAGDSLVVIVRDYPEALMPARARGELVAALSCVRAVLLEDLPESAVDSWEDADRRDAELFIEFVKRRCS